jgi:hypothetical protein
MTAHHFPFRLLADLVRVGAAVGVAAALFQFPGNGAGARFLLVLLALLVPRALGGVPGPLDLTFGVTLLATAWASTTWTGAPVMWVLQTAATALSAVVLWLVLARAGLLAHPADEPARPDGRLQPTRLLSRPSPDGGSVASRSWARRGRVVAQTAAIGLLVCLVWEGARWLEAATRPTVDAMAAGSPVAHVLVGTLGALLGGCWLAEFVRGSSDRGADADRPRVSGQVPLGG